MNRSMVCLAFLVGLSRGAAAQAPSGPEPEEVAANDTQDPPRDQEQRARDQERQARDQERAARDRERAVRDQERDAHRQEEEARDHEQYERGTAAIEAESWNEAIAAFEGAASGTSRRRDAALYWKAYAQSKAGRRPEALATLQDLRRLFPKSRWLRQAQALELEVRQSGGQTPNPESQGDEDLKLMALNGLLNMDAERAVPMLEKFLAGQASPKLRERALFVLCQSSSPRAREIVVKIARGGDSPDLQRKALEYLGLFGGTESRHLLGEIYSSSADVEVKKAILRSFMIRGEKGPVLTAAKGETNPELRREAIQQLGVLGAHDELWALYQSETSSALKREIVNALFVGGSTDRLLELARSEKDPQLRGEAIKHLGLVGEDKTGSFLLSLYGSEKDPEVRRQVLQGLFLQGNAAALIEIARSEKDPKLRRDAVGHLSHMDSKQATEFMLEILNK